jgi:hypothetical protein
MASASAATSSSDFHRGLFPDSTAATSSGPIESADDRKSATGTIGVAGSGAAVGTGPVDAIAAVGSSIAAVIADGGAADGSGLDAAALDGPGATWEPPPASSTTAAPATSAIATKAVALQGARPRVRRAEGSLIGRVLASCVRVYPPMSRRNPGQPVT